MKKLQKLFMAVAAVAGVTACTTDATEDLGVNLNEGPKTLTLSLDDTRTQLGEKADGTYPLTWAENDAISVNGSVSNPLTADEAGAASATFTFNNGFGSAPYFVAYPATSTNNQVVFAAEQTHTSNTTFGNGATVMYGYANDLSSVKLNHLTGVLKIGVVSGTEGPAFIKEVRISTVDRKPIAGTFSVDAEGKLTPVKTADVITYKSESDAGFLVLPVAENNPVTYIHVAVPAGVYGELYVTLESADGVMYKTVKTDSTKPVNAGAVREFSSNIAFVPVAETETFVIADYSDLYEFKEAVEGGSTLNAIFVNDVEMPGVDDLNYPAWEPINAPSYTGTITGNGYAIKGLYAPLFNVTAASFKGLHLDVVVEEKVNPIFGAFARQLVANGNAPKVEHCSVNGSITINTDIAPAKADVLEDGATGGFVGIASGVHFEDCVNNATLELKQYSSTVKMWGIMGGLVGLTNTANELFTSFKNCTNNGNLNYTDATGKTAADLGGIVSVYEGYMAVATFDNCTNNGHLTVHEGASCRDFNAGGMISTINGARDGGGKNNRKTITFTNNTTNNGNILLSGTAANTPRLGGIIGYTAKFANVEVSGPLTNNGSITLAGTAKGNAMVGGMLGSQTGGTAFNMRNTATNTEKATILVSGTMKGEIYVGGFLGYSSGGSSEGYPAMRIITKTATNNAAITISGTIGSYCCMGGYSGYTYNTNLYHNSNGLSVNNGTLTISETAVITADLRLGGLSGYVNYNGFRAGDKNKGGTINRGEINLKGEVKGNCFIGGLIGIHRNTFTTSELQPINIGNINALGKIDTSKHIRIGGAVGMIGSVDDIDNNLQKPIVHCEIKAYHVAEDGTVTPYPQVGMITGSSDEQIGTVSNVKLGGKIATTATVANGVATPTWVEVNATNYFDYVTGLRAGLTEYADATFLKSKDAIEYGNYGK